MEWVKPFCVTDVTEPERMESTFMNFQKQPEVKTLN